MNATKKRPAAKKAPAKKLSPAALASINQYVDAARGKPGFPIIRALAELHKLGPVKIKRLKV